MTITLAPCSDRPARADIDPLSTGFYEELSPKLVSVGSSAVDIPFWIEDFRHHSDQYLPPHGRIWIARDDTGQAVGVRNAAPDQARCGGDEAALFPPRGTRSGSRAPPGAGAHRRRSHDGAGFISSAPPSVTISRCRHSISPSVFRFIDPHPESGVATTSNAYAWTLKFMQLDL